MRHVTRRSRNLVFPAQKNVSRPIATNLKTKPTTKMKNMKINMPTRILNLLTAAALLAGTQIGWSLGPGFTYEGRLRDNGNFPNATYDMRFTLYDALTG